MFRARNFTLNRPRKVASAVTKLCPYKTREFLFIKIKIHDVIISVIHNIVYLTPRTHCLFSVSVGKVLSVALRYKE